MHTKRNISLSILFTFFLFAVTGVFLLVQCSDMVADMTGNKDDKGFNEEYPGLCDMDEECPEGFICVDGRCIAYENPIPCFANADCPADYACFDRFCVGWE
jgi:hypothetical protein